MKERKGKKVVGNPVAKHGILIILAVVTGLLVILVTINLLAPKEEEQSFDAESWKTAVQQTPKTYDSGLTSVAPSKPPASAAPTAPAESDATGPKTEKTAATPAEPAKKTLFLLPVSGSIMKDYAADDLVYSATMEDWRVHEGIDFAAQEGTDVVAVADGTVEAVISDGMLGTCILVAHPDGVKSFYANLQEGSPVSEGSAVVAGSVIGKVGNSSVLEAKDEPHLHFEVLKQDKPVNPHDYFETAPPGDDGGEE